MINQTVSWVKDPQTEGSHNLVPVIFEAVLSKKDDRISELETQLETLKAVILRAGFFADQHTAGAYDDKGKYIGTKITKKERTILIDTFGAEQVSDWLEKYW